MANLVEGEFHIKGRFEPPGEFIAGMGRASPQEVSRRFQAGTGPHLPKERTSDDWHWPLKQGRDQFIDRRDQVFVIGQRQGYRPLAGGTRLHALGDEFAGMDQ